MVDRKAAAAVARVEEFAKANGQGSSQLNPPAAVHQRLRHISKQGNVLLRLLLVEAAQAAARFDPEWHKKFSHLAMRRERQIAKVAMARKLADPNCCPSQRLVVDLELRADSLVLRRQTVVAEP